jgi:uncharacterized protein YbjT (DUF2867 family)
LSQVAQLLRCLMSPTQLDVVTGALGYTGKYIARRLLATGRRVRTLVSRLDRPNPFGDQLEVAPLDFGRPDALVNHLRGVDTLFNTYWVRFSRGQTTFDRAVENTRVLIQAASDAGVRLIVHVSVTCPSENLPLPYFRGKAALEKIVIESGLPYVIVRPALIFGDEDILVHNIAWFLRRLPVFVVPGDGRYRVQPVFVGDLAELAVRLADGAENVTVDAVGPETFTFEEFVRVIARAIGRRGRIVHMSPGITCWLTAMAGRLVGDVVLTRDEIAGLMADLLVSDRPPTCSTRFTDWLRDRGEALGANYVSELARHYT